MGNDILNKTMAWKPGEDLTILSKDRFGVVVQGIGYGDGRTHTHDGGEGQHQTYHDTGKVDSRHSVQYH